MGLCIEVLIEGLGVDGLQIDCFELILLLLGHWVHYIEGNILGDLDEEAPDVSVALASMEQIDLFESS